MRNKTALPGAAIFSVFLLNIMPAWSGDKTLPDTMIVEGSRLSQTASELGSSVSILTKDDLAISGFGFALDALARVPGVTINQNGSLGGSASVRIRGASSEQTLVLIDGVPVNDPSAPGGGFNFARLDTNNIERIEVLKGPQSTLWGTDAIGGVVSIITKHPGKGVHSTAFSEYGSFNTFRGGGSVGYGTGKGDFRLAVVDVKSDGISKADEDNGNTEEDAYDALTLSAKGSFVLDDALRLSSDILWTEASSEFDSFSGGAQGRVADGDKVSKTEEFVANVSLTGTFFEGRLENLLSVGYSDISRKNLTNGTPDFSAEGDRVIYRYQGNLNINTQNKLAFGAEREDTTANGKGSVINGFFALYESKPFRNMTITGGLRVDDHERFGSETTGRVTAAYNPVDPVILRASWGQGFKVPTIFQTTYLCCGASAPNAGLSPETSEAFDTGIDWRSADGRARAGITFFHQDTENQIAFSFAKGGYENIAIVESRGVEMYGTYALTGWLSLSADYAFIDAKDGAGDRLVRLPEHSGDITVSLNPDSPFSGAILLRYNGKEKNNNGTTLDSWTRVDVTGRYTLNEHFELFGRIENFFNTDYQQILGYGTPDLSGFIGIRARY